MQGEHAISVGSLVVDRDDESDDPSTAVVVRRPSATASEWQIEGTDKTVADYNPDYADSPVVIVAFEGDLDEIGGWQVSTPESLWPFVEANDVRHYAYPEMRLDRVGEADIRWRETDDGHRFIHRLHISGVGRRLVYGTDYDGTDHQYGIVREVCFNRSEWDVAEGNVVHVKYSHEKDIGDDYPPLLTSVEEMHVIEKEGSIDFLLDL